MERALDLALGPSPTAPAGLWQRARQLPQSSVRHSAPGLLSGRRCWPNSVPTKPWIPVPEPNGVRQVVHEGSWHSLLDDRCCTECPRLQFDCPSRAHSFHETERCDHSLVLTIGADCRQAHGSLHSADAKRLQRPCPKRRGRQDWPWLQASRATRLWPLRRCPI